MTSVIFKEINFFMISIAWGGLILILYDVLRIFRNLIKHSIVVSTIEDIIYWIICGFLVFQMMYKHNNGIIRAFSILGMLIGMIIYRYLFSDIIVESLSLLLIKIKNLIYLVISRLLKPLLWIKGLITKTIGKKVGILLGKSKKVVKKAINLLKKIGKSSKIPLYEAKDGDLLDEEKKKK